MASPPFNIGLLPDHLLLEILERLDLREALRAGAVSTRWRHLPHQLSHLHLDIGHFHGTTPVEMMDTFTGAARRLLSACPPPAATACKCSRSIKTIVLSFYMSDLPQLISIGRTVEDVVSGGETEYLKFHIFPPPTSSSTTPPLAESGQRLMSFSRTCPVAFRWLTDLSLENLTFGDPDVSDLISACDKLKYLTLRSCGLVDRHSALKIDTPCSTIYKLSFFNFSCRRIEFISVPSLRKMWYESWQHDNPPVHFGYVPKLRQVSLASRARAWQVPFVLSECFSKSATDLLELYLNFGCEAIWIQPEHPKHLTTIFRNLTHAYLYCIFPECELSWTIFIVEAAPALLKFTLCRNRHSCVKTSDNSAEKTNMLWEPSKDWKHLNLKLLVLKGFEEEEKVTNYLLLFMERALGLKRIELRGKSPCPNCNDIDLESRISHVDEASRYQLKE